MNLLFEIVVIVIFLIFILLGVGAFLHRIFKFEMNTLSNVNIH